MTDATDSPRVIDPEILKHLSPEEEIVARTFLLQGRWILKQPEAMESD